MLIANKISPEKAAEAVAKLGKEKPEHKFYTKDREVHVEIPPTGIDEPNLETLKHLASEA